MILLHHPPPPRRCQRPGEAAGVPARGPEAAAAGPPGDAALPHGSPQEVGIHTHAALPSLFKKEGLCFNPLFFWVDPPQSDPEREGQLDVQREPGHRVRADADEGAGPGRHDGAQRHPIPETGGGEPHHQRGRALLRGVGGPPPTSSLPPFPHHS